MHTGWDTGRLYNGVRLPSARDVSINVLSTSRVTPDDTYSHMLMQWGQFIDHDIDFVPTAVAHARFSDGRNCNETCEASGPCFPIPVSADDPRVRRRRCIGFVRSSAMCGRYSVSPVTSWVVLAGSVASIRLCLRPNFSLIISIMLPLFSILDYEITSVTVLIVY